MNTRAGQTHLWDADLSELHKPMDINYLITWIELGMLAWKYPQKARQHSCSLVGVLYGCTGCFLQECTTSPTSQNRVPDGSKPWNRNRQSQPDVPSWIPEIWVWRSNEHSRRERTQLERVRDQGKETFQWSQEPCPPGSQQQVNMSVSWWLWRRGEVCPSHPERENHSVLAPREALSPHDLISWEGQWCSWIYCTDNESSSVKHGVEHLDPQPSD